MHRAGLVPISHVKKISFHCGKYYSGDLCKVALCAQAETVNEETGCVNSVFSMAFELFSHHFLCRCENFNSNVLTMFFEKNSKNMHRKVLLKSFPMVGMSVDFDNLKLFGQFLCRALRQNR
jgi:hypothetical protein